MMDVIFYTWVGAGLLFTIGSSILMLRLALNCSAVERRLNREIDEIWGCCESCSPRKLPGECSDA